MLWDTMDINRTLGFTCESPASNIGGVSPLFSFVFPEPRISSNNSSDERMYINFCSSAFHSFQTPLKKNILVFFLLCGPHTSH